MAHGKSLELRKPNRTRPLIVQRNGHFQPSEQQKAQWKKMLRRGCDAMKIEKLCQKLGIVSPEYMDTV